MDTVKLKQSIITRIHETDDLDLLEALDALLYSDDETPMELSAEQTRKIAAAKKEIEAGSFIDDNTFKKEVKSWLRGR